MLTRILTLSAFAVSVVSAFRDASPFYLMSTAELPELQRNDRIATADSIIKDLSTSLSECPTEAYIIVDQAGVSAADFASRDSTPHMSRRLSGKDKSLKTITSVANTVGSLAKTDLERDVLGGCGAQSVMLDGSELPSTSAAGPQIITINFASAPVSKAERVTVLRRNDVYLNEVIASLPSDKYTIIYRTTPAAVEQNQQSEHSEQHYEMDEPYPTGLHIDLKRDFEAHAATNGSNLDYDLGLFEKYQFLSSGIFMGGTVSLLLLVILYAGVSAISGLEVSYMAFSKEMNPANQKKQQ